MNWYRTIVADREYWLMNGTAVGAGDDGDYNHVAHVVETVQAAHNLERYDLNSGRGIQQVINLAIQRGMKVAPGEEVDINDALAALGLDAEEIGVLTGGTDERLFGMKRYNWQRVQGNNIETWTLTPEDLINIVNGIYDIQNIDMEDGEEPVYAINVMSTGAWYEDVPLSVLQKAEKAPLVLNSYLHQGWATANHWQRLKEGNSTKTLYTK